ncbi:hypothetical protein AX16_003421 [Volvariella volvacea WC 439]|nr:hypothetical protein AX16_003421 [Volvariella volvacea WC 439]
MVGLSTVASAVTPAPPPSAVTSGSPRKSPTLGKNKHVAFDASSSASANANAPPILTSSLSSSPPRASAAGGVLSSSPPRDGSVLSSSLYYRGPPASSSAVYNALPPGAAAPVPIGAAAAISGNGSGPGEVVSPVTYNTVKSNTPSVVEDSGSRPRTKTAVAKKNTTTPGLGLKAGMEAVHRRALIRMLVRRTSRPQVLKRL